ncbi:PH domain-containing protein [Candidatus Woesearchaeota archaeon]|nr:PH domain-containing protein [Candidatus Woesearchaeota archaeon]
MFNLDKHLDSNEKLIIFFRPSRKAYIHHYIIFAKLFLVFMTLFFMLIEKAEFYFKPLAILCLTAALFFIVMLARVEYRIWSRRYGLTNERLLYSRGIFDQVFKSSHYNYVTDVGMYQSLWDKMMKTGTIMINTAGTDKYEIKYRKIADPYKIERMINDLTDKARRPERRFHPVQAIHPAHHLRNQREHKETRKTKRSAIAHA